MLFRDVIEIVFIPSEEIAEYNKLLDENLKQEEIDDDLYFVKHLRELDKHIWVGSPIKNSTEEKEIKNLFKKGKKPEAVITSLSKNNKYTYSVVLSYEDDGLDF